MRLTLVFFFFILLPNLAFSQKYLILDNYGKKRYYYNVGDAILFKQKNDPTLFKDVIHQLSDTSFILESIREPMKLENIEYVYRPNGLARGLVAGLTFLGAGFAASGLINYARTEAGNGSGEYNHQQALWMGGSFLAGATIAYALRWHKWKIEEDKVRIRILDTSFEDPDAEEEGEDEESE